ncbi:hypothetical protein PF010_g31177 [Phytophthora fragariae]|uniref:Uncharacterized protein n=3 Tax=Phytophthora fragariae TaxID=53985 RepID=A0A6A3D9U5_9STRA|nr:hypothetical protein PF003_g28003 [Phytophthora fragariae]KAE8917765.1 hypothetical protein PF009_g31915 [Phytophthora fragariae]KAE9057952.1 hypothetical protein PF010_g31177 [Phytophthora fragariae]KAE9061417.1 hypothetical protein PF006_g31406 [Phytophthora fragariae]KAE9264322.1 hypothetical protein PF001_g31332 [Phytophthora fragariae]
MRLNTGGDDGDGDEVVVISGVAISAAGDDDSDDHSGDSSGGGDGHEDGGWSSAANQQPASNQQAASNQREEARASNQRTMAASSNQDEELEAMDWWEVLNPAQQRAMMKRFITQPTVIAAPAPVATTAMDTQPRRTKRKKLLIDDFKGTASESVEAWLATVPQEVSRQRALGGDTWTSEELFYGGDSAPEGSGQQMVH